MAADDERGFFSEHDQPDQHPLQVATSEEGQHSAIRPSRRPIACMRFEDFHFEFDSSFLKSNAASELTLLAKWHDHLGHPSLGVFGHADPVGSDDYNKTLSGRRAQAMYGLLVRRTDLWDELWSTPFGGDNWQNIASARVAHEQGFAAYMDSICQDGSGQPWKVDKREFLGQGKDSGGKGDYQGCGEFNPVLRFSRADESELSAPARKDERDRRNASNRRVLVFLWPPGLTVDPAGWPCPRVKESAAGCRSQFWPDGDTRRNPKEEQREYAKDHDTFACRWYDGLARESPCEAARKLLQIRLMDGLKIAMPEAPYRLTIGSVEVRNNKATSDGTLREENVLAGAEVKLEWGFKDGSDMCFENTIRLDYDRGDGNEPSVKRLRNLGYTHEDFGDNVRAFKHDYEISPEDDNIDTAKADLENIHDNRLSKAQFKEQRGSNG